MTATQLAKQMGKSLSWVTRLRDAYTFGRKFVEHVDGDDGPKLAAKHFSVLEEISKSNKIGPLLRDYDNPDHDQLRSEIFDMVRAEVFSEYRDARFMKEFHDDPDKWAQLKSGEKHIAKKLALEVRTGSNGVKAKVAALEKQVQRAVERETGELDEADAELLRRCAQLIEDQAHVGVNPFQLRLKELVRTLLQASLADVEALSAGELAEFEKARKYFGKIVAMHEEEDA